MPQMIYSLVMMVLLFAGAVSAVYSLVQIPVTQWRTVFMTQSSAHWLETVLDGHATQAFAKTFNQHFIGRQPLSQFAQGVAWKLTGDLGYRVHQGCGDWLFLHDELTIHPSAETNAVQRAAIVQQVQQELAKRHIQLLVVMIPDKSRIQAKQLCDVPRARVLDERLNAWVNVLQQRHIQVLDTSPILNAIADNAYYHTDSHWNPAGANATAYAIANRLNQKPNQKTNQASVLQPAMVQVRHAIQYDGDLVRLANLGTMPTWLRPAREASFELKIPAQSTPQQSSQEDDLFGDAGLPTIAVMGTSFSRNAQFIPLLSHYLGESVVNVAQDGGDFAGSPLKYLQSTAFKQTPPKTIVWEIPERMLQQPLKAEDHALQAWR
jgi:alginate O-acetyltransferase complex protein AlgJ